jgi:septal ring factor EnvC (AmiA/AmiB activator)
MRERLFVFVCILAFSQFCILPFSPSLHAQESDRSRAEALSRRADEQLRALQREAERLASEEKTLLGELRKLEVQRELNVIRLRQLDGEIGDVESELKAAAERSDALQRQDAVERPKLRHRLVDVYKLGGARYVRLLLSTSDWRDMAAASRTVAALAKLDQERVASHRRTLDELEKTRATLAAQQTRLTTLRVAARTAQHAVEQAARDHDALIKDIDNRRDLNAQLSSELQESQQKLQSTLRRMGSPLPLGTPAASADDAQLPLKPFRGALDWPVAGAIRRHMIRTATDRSPAANAIEIAAPEGAPVAAVHDGVVAFADLFSGFGNLVIIDHGSQNYTLYGNLLNISVSKGAHVEQGRVVGTVGTPTTSPSAVPGLYFELRVDGQPVDPLQWLKKR